MNDQKSSLNEEFMNKQRFDTIRNLLTIISTLARTKCTPLR